MLVRQAATLSALLSSLVFLGGSVRLLQCGTEPKLEQIKSSASAVQSL
jgi:hypothetical protein